jgi:hypothetical protein
MKLIPRKDQQCGNCDAYSPRDSNQGECLGACPTPILVGMQEQRVMNIGGGPPQMAPIINTYFPPVGKNRWCRQWAPKTDGEA